MSAEVEKKIGDVKVRIDRGSCIGSANCVKVAPELFAIDDEGIVVFAPGAGNASAETVEEACRICPVEALFLTDASGEQIVP
ncbi:ferredoxin [bacterium]|nr:ferredoxin [bacterium]